MNILVNNCPLNDRPVANAQRGNVLGEVCRQMFRRLVVVVPENHGVANDDVSADLTPKADHTVFDHRAGSDRAAIGDQA